MGKEDFLPGQTKELAENAADTEALTIFYTTLYQQRPDSEMAAKFLLQHGLLEEDEATRLVKKFGKSGGSSKAASKPKPKVQDASLSRKGEYSQHDAHLCAVCARVPCTRRATMTTTSPLSQRRHRPRRRRPRRPLHLTPAMYVPLP